MRTVVSACLMGRDAMNTTTPPDCVLYQRWESFKIVPMYETSHGLDQLCHPPGMLHYPLEGRSVG